MIYLGTAGWSYSHWRGTFYPRGVDNELRYYSSHSLLNEINTTFYRVPSEEMVQRWHHVTPEDFIFSAKLNREVTHGSFSALNPYIIERFFERLGMLEGKLRTVLVQFPPRFRNTPETHSYLAKLLKECSTHFSGQLVLEVRNKSWFNDEVKDLLSDKGVSFAETTTLSIPEEYQNKDVPLYYIRLLGDRRIIPDEKLGKFFLEKDREREDWAQKLVQLSKTYKTVFVLINNRFSGYAINDAIILRKILSKQRIEAQGFEKAGKYVRRQKSLTEFF